MIKETAKEAGKEWWQDNGKGAVDDALAVALKFFNENQNEIVKSALENASKLADKALEEAKAYIDTQLNKQREVVVGKLVANGATREEIDTNLDGQITDDEIQNYVLKNPFSLWYAGAALAAWYALKKGKEKLSPQVVQAPAPPTQISS